MAQPTKNLPQLVEEDELPLALPSRDGDLDEDESRGPSDQVDDSDLGLDALDGDERVGLDTTEGLDEPLELEMGLSDTDEGQAWSDGAEPLEDLDEPAEDGFGGVPAVVVAVGVVVVNRDGVGVGSGG